MPAFKRFSDYPRLSNIPAGALGLVSYNGESYSVLMSALANEAIDVSIAGASPSAGPSVNRSAIQDSINRAQDAGGGIVLFPGGPSTSYPIDAQIAVTGSNVKLWAPGGARLKPTVPIPVLLAVGDIDTGLNQSQGNTLASNAVAGTDSVTLAAGKGANITVGSWIQIRSQAVVPDHDSAVTNKRCEFVNVQAKAGDVLTLSAPLRFTYNTADTAEVCNVTWIENFGMEGLGIDGNEHIDCAIGVQMSWVLAPTIVNVSATKLAQRFVRFQGALGHLAWGVRQTDGFSTGYFGTGFAYSTGEHGLCQGGIIGDLRIDRCRHGYTTGAGVTTNLAVTSASSGYGVPMDTIVGPGVHLNSRGAGWDTHEVGLNITFRGLKTLGSMELGFQVRSVRTRFVEGCFARDCKGGRLQIGSDARDTIVTDLDGENTNTGTTSVDWTKYSEIVDNSPRSYLGDPQPNLIDNGGFDRWERGTSFTTTASTANRWKFTLGTGATVTVSRQSHAAGSGGPGAGPYYLRLNRTVTGSAASVLSQFREEIREWSDQRLAISFNAFASTNDVPVDVVVRQYFGTGGAPSADVSTTAVQRLISDSFHRYTVLIDVPSVTGKTFGTNGDAALEIQLSLPTSAGNVHVNFDWVKLEVGRTPTSYVPLPPAIEAERCKRWYEKSYLDDVAPGANTSVGAVSQVAPVAASTYGRAWVQFATRKGRNIAGTHALTVKLYSTDGTIDKVRDTVGAANIDGAVTDSAGPQLNGYYGGANGAGVDVGDVIKWHWTAAVTDFE